MANLLEIRNIRKNYGDTNPVKLLKGISSELIKPERIAILGASGQGKSTLLRILARLEVPDEGEILFRGHSADRIDPREWRMRVCYVSQQPYMLSGSVRDNLRTVSTLHQLPFEEELALRLMKDMDMQHIDWDKKASDLSGGEKQRVALVRALMLRSEILLLDEVTASLDVDSKLKVEQVLKSWSEQECTALIWITHDHEQAQRFAQRVWFIQDGLLKLDVDSVDFTEILIKEEL